MTRDELLTKLAMELAEWPLDSGQARRAMPGIEWSTMGVSVFAAVFNGRDVSEKEYLQRRAELINKPSWGSVGDWIQWIAQAPSGHWEGFSIKPSPGEYWRHRDRGGRGCRIQEGRLPAGIDWLQTLEQRPETPCMDCGTTDSVHARDCPSHEWDQGEQRIDNIGRNGEAETRHDCQRCGGSYYTPPHDECPCCVSDGSTASYYELPDGATELQDLISYRNMNHFDAMLFILCYDHSFAKSDTERLRIAREMVHYASREACRLQGVHTVRGNKAP